MSIKPMDRRGRHLMQLLYRHYGHLNCLEALGDAVDADLGIGDGKDYAPEKRKSRHSNVVQLCDYRPGIFGRPA